MATFLLVPSRRTVGTRRFVGLVVAAMLLARLPFMFQPLHADEAGYLLVAKSWHLGGVDLYGPYWVDRPPLLIAIFKLASLVPWDPMVRVLLVPFAVLFVVSAAWAAHQLAGPRAARWSAVVAAAFMATPLLATQEADGELFAAPLVMLAMALTIAAVRRTGRPSYGLAFFAGLCAGLAVMVKQNFGDAAVFAVTLLLASIAQRRVPPRHGLRLLGAVVGGGALVAVGAVGYALWSGVGVGEMWFDLYGFRTEAFDVIEDGSMRSAVLRAAGLVLLGLVCGAIPAVVLLARRAWRSRLSGPPVAWALAVTMALEVLAIVAGGSYWPHYLLQLAPTLALAVGLWVPKVRWLAATAVLAVASAVVSTVVFVGAGLGATPGGQRLGTWVHRASRPHDTLTVLYGNEEVLLSSRLRSPYPYLWTLPMRTLDPHLSLLRATLTGPAAPTWVMVWDSVNDWNIDASDQTRLDLATHYHLVQRVCGHQLWLRDGVRRPLPPAPQC
ncbi:MAG: hypothetical protein ACXVEU_16110 [Nocardioidaceae bacterium]